LPEFLGTFEPDAIATGKTPNLLIEVVTPRGSGNVQTTKVKQLQQLLEGRPDWRLEVLYTSPSTPPPAVASVKAIRHRLGEVRGLEHRDRPAALILAWSLLEAVARHLVPERASRAMTPATTVELLTSMGYIVQSEADSLRAAARARNLIVHGDIDEGVPAVQLQNLFEIIEALVGYLERQPSLGKSV
jgi:uncharacterized protein YutE (UPF0331/DUF86 family)